MKPHPLLALAALGFALNAGAAISSHGQQPEAQGSLSGRVLTTDAEPQVVDRAVVVATDAQQAVERRTVSNAAGEFAFAGLRPGRYRLQASRPGFVSIAFGALRAGHEGAAVVVGAGQEVSGLALRLARGAVITGTIRDESGSPIPGLLVGARAVSTRNRLVIHNVRTNDLGVYRFFGLPADEYVVFTLPTGNTPFASPDDRAVDAALGELRLSRGRGAAAGRKSTSPPDSVEQAPATKYRHTAVYYPAAFSADVASSIFLSAGEERGGIDITARPMSSFRMTGELRADSDRWIRSTILTLRGAKPGTLVWLQARPDDNGRFSFEAVAPGQYVLTALAQFDGSCRLASQELDVAGDINGVSLVLQSCPQVSGRVDVGRPLPGGATLQLIFEQRPGSPKLVGPPLRHELRIEPDGSFGIRESVTLLPSHYRLQAELRGLPNLKLSSATYDRREILDVGLEVPNNLERAIAVELTFVSSPASLGGRLETRSDDQALNYSVVVFPTARELWHWPTRRVRSSTPATDGQFLFDDLPPGEYFIAALRNPVPDDWREFAVLSEVAPSALKVNVLPGQLTTQTVRIVAR